PEAHRIFGARGNLMPPARDRGLRAGARSHGREVTRVRGTAEAPASLDHSLDREPPAPGAWSPSGRWRCPGLAPDGGQTHCCRDTALFSALESVFPTRARRWADALLPRLPPRGQRAVQAGARGPAFR